MFSKLKELFEFRRKVRLAGLAQMRDPITHIVIMDGTLSSLDPGRETNAGLTFKLCKEAARNRNMLVRYEAGIQWSSLKDTRSVIEGRGINEQIKRVYGALASRYRAGDKIYLFGYSRGAYAVRSLAGLISRVGLLKIDEASQRNVETAYRYYQTDPNSPASKEFSELKCHSDVPVEFLGVWDTVDAVGIQLPLLWKFSSVFHKFYDLVPSKNIKNVFHALAYHERRIAYEPVMFWTNPYNTKQRLEQMWFRGTHADVGGQISNFVDDRLLPNATLGWMLEKAEDSGLKLPNGWRDRYEADALGKSAGQNRGWGKLFWFRRKRLTCRDPSEVLHPSIEGSQEVSCAKNVKPPRQSA